MSLTRTSATDQLEPERRGSNASQHRKMSFNPISEWVPPKEDRQPSVSALDFEEVSKGKRLGKPSVVMYQSIVN